jgi:autotransporter-associated beta strand protein
MGALNANLILDAKSTISAGLNGGDFLNPIQVQDVSAGTTGQPVIVKLNGIVPSHGLTYLSGGSVLTYVTEGGQGAVPTFLPWLDSYGTKDIAVQDDGVGSVNLVLTDSATTRGWAKDVPGSWNDSANWLGGVPNATTAKAWFTQSAGGQPVAVSLDSSVTVSSMMFNTGAGTGYTISSPGAQTITLQSTIAANTHIEVVSGDHVINSNIVMAQGDPLINVAVGQKLTLNGVLSNLSGSVGISFEGNGDGKSQIPTYGTLELTGLNTFTGPVVMSNYGRLVIDKLGALGQSSVDPANLVINGILSYTGTATTPTTVVMNRGYTAAGVFANVAAASGFRNGIEVADANVNLKITGQVVSPTNYVSAFRKTGLGTLTYANTGTANTLGGGDFQVGEGTVVFEAGTYSKGRNTITSHGGGNFVVGDTAGVSPTLKVVSGAVVNNGGDLLVAQLPGTTGTMLVDAATMNVNAWTYIGMGTGATGNVTVRNGGVLNTAGLLWIGKDGGTGNLTMSAGAVATANNNELYVGAGVGGIGHLTMSDNAKMTVNGWSQVGRDGGTGTLDMTGSSNFTTTEELRVGWIGGKGTLNMSGSTTLNAANMNAVGCDPGSEAYINLSEAASVHTNAHMRLGSNGGIATVAVGGNATFTAGTDMWIGDSGTGTVNVNNTATVSANKMFVGGYAGTSQLNATSGVVSTASDFSVGYNWGSNVGDQGNHVVNASGSTISVGGSLILGANSGKGTYNQVAGHTTVVGSVVLGEGDYTDNLANQVGAHGDAVLNLNGGTLTASGMTTRSKTISAWAPAQWLDPPTNTVPNPEYPGDTGMTRVHATTAVVNFNGGTLQAGASNANFIATDDAAANLTLNVLAGGALIDTQAFDVTITKQLLGSTGDTGLKKLGTGTLTLTVDPTYNGNTTVDAGTLTVGNLTHSANVYVASTGTLNATSIVTGTLTIGGPASSASVTAVPEPSTIVLLVLAGLGALLAWRRK